MASLLSTLFVTIVVAFVWIAHSRDQATQHARQAEQQSVQVQLELARNQCNRGLALCERGEINHGILWLARSLNALPKFSEELQPGADDLERLIRVNLSAWGSSLNELHAFYPYEQPKRRSGLTLTNGVAIDPDGRLLLGAKLEKAELWNTITGDLVATIQHPGAISSDSATKSGNEVTRRGPILAVDFNHDGSMFATVAGGTLQLWETKGQRPIGNPIEFPVTLGSVKFSPDGSRVVTHAGPIHQSWVNREDLRCAFVWDIDASRKLKLRHPTSDRSSYPLKIAFSPDGKQIATAHDESVHLWDAQSGKMLQGPLNVSDHFVNGIQFSHDGNKLLTTSSSHYERKWSKTSIWDLSTREIVGTPFKHHSEVSSSWKFDRLVTGSQDGTVRLWTTRTMEPIAGGLTSTADPVTNVSFNPDGQLILMTSQKRLEYGSRVDNQLWDARTLQRVGSPMSIEGRQSHTEFSSDGKYVVTAGRTWRVNDGGLVTERQRWPQAISVAVVSPDGRYLYVSADPSSVQVLDAKTGKLICRLHTPGRLTGMRFFDNGSVVFIENEAVGKLFATKTGKKFAEIDYGRLTDISKSGTVAVSIMEKTATIWDTKTGRSIATFENAFTLHGAAISPDATTLITSGSNWNWKQDANQSIQGEIRFWNIKSKGPAKPIIETSSAVAVLGYREDGEAFCTIESTGVDHHIQNRCWRSTDDGKLLDSKPFDIKDVSHTAARRNGRPRKPTALIAYGASGRGQKLHDATSDGKIALYLKRFYDVASGQPIGPILEHQGFVTCVDILPDEHKAIIAGGGTGYGFIKHLKVPQPMVGTPKAITQRIERMTGLKLTEADEIKSLTAEEWQALPASNVSTNESDPSE